MALASAAASAAASASALAAADAPRDAGGGGDAPDAKAPLTKPEREALARFRDKLALGRKATQDKRWSDAENAFTSALAARPTDARARAERGYARFLADDLDGASEDFDRALAGGVDAKLAGQLFYNLGLLREKRKLADGARAAFAVSNALTPSAAAKAKLGGRSTCTADVDEQPPPGDDLHLVASFETLATEIRPGKDLGSPKASVCIRTHTAMEDPDDRDVCSGDLPWILNHHHLMFTEDLYLVVPQKSGPGLLYFSGRVGSWPAHCTNLPSPSGAMAGDFLRVTSTFDGAMAALDDSKEIAESEMQMPCADVLGYTEEVFYETKAGKRVLRIYMPSGVPAPQVKTGADGRTVTLSGAGCDRTIVLSAR